jgi:hypothetical protein
VQTGPSQTRPAPLKPTRGGKVVTDLTIHKLEDLAAVLNETEHAITQTDLEATQHLINDLRGRIIASDLPPVVISFLLLQCLRMEQGVWEYRITGVAAFYASAAAGGDAWARGQEEVAPYAEVEIVKETLGAWETIDVVANTATVLDDSASIVRSVTTIFLCAYLGTLVALGSTVIALPAAGALAVLLASSRRKVKNLLASGDDESGAPPKQITAGGGG